MPYSKHGVIPQEVTEENVRVVSQARPYAAGSYSLEMISITVKGFGTFVE